jgi:type I restriction enzyme S subunit
LEQYKKGVTQKIFTQELRFKDDSDKDFPEWEKFKITQIAETSIGLVTTMTTSYVEFGVPLIRNSDIKENRIEKSQLIYLDETFATKHKHKKLKTGDIVTVHTGLIGVSAVIDETMNGCLGFATLNTRVNRDLVIPEFICIYYNTPTYINYAISVATGDGRSNYNLKDFDKAIIPVPSLKEQVKILNFLNNIDFKLNNCRLRIEQIELFKKGLLQNMFI